MEIITREIVSSNWITITLLLCFVLLAAAKVLNSIQFSEFILLFNTNKYFMRYQKENRLNTVFNWMLVLAQIGSISLFIYICVTSFQLNEVSDGSILFFKIATLYFIFLICKLLIEKIIATLFSIEYLMEGYLFYKMSYRNFFGLILLPFNLFFIYTFQPVIIALQILLACLFITNLVVLAFVYKKNEKIIWDNLLYFILYLCTLEIAPYFIIYKLIVK